MAQFTTFIVNHPWLVSLFVFALIALIFIEIRGKSKLVVDVQRLVNYVNHDSAELWDLRSRKDYDQGHITAAEHVELDQLDKRMKKQMARAGKNNHPIILLCQNGMHSAHHVKKLVKARENIFYLQGGITEWQSQRLPVVKS